MALYTSARARGMSFDDAIKQPMKAALVSPYFLFEATDPASEFALASRLSYFLWSSMPDDELLALAEKGTLRANLEPQVKRMLASPKSHALAENFAGQWLETRNLQLSLPIRNCSRNSTRVCAPRCAPRPRCSSIRWCTKIAGSSIF